MTQTLVLTYQIGGFKAVHVGHAHVHQNHGEILTQQPAQRFLSRRRRDRVASRSGEQSLHGEERPRIIVDDQYVSCWFGLHS